MNELYQLVSDPFDAAAVRTRNAVIGRDEGKVSGAISNVVPALGNALLNAVTFPGRYARGETGYAPGQMVEEQPQATNWAADTAMNMVGAPAMTGGVPGMGSGIRAYHGSPHDFDRFDLSKIGTGEGAQAYGHGLYFAENPKTAEFYKQSLAMMSGTNDAERLAAVYLDQYGKHALESVRRDSMAKHAHPGTYDPVIKLLESGWTPKPGRMYEVNINAHPDQFLDWDKPLLDQSPQVKAAFENIRGMPGTEQLWGIAGNLRQALPGESAVRQLNKTVGPQEASSALREAGIPGIQYYDQGSRFGDKGNATRNYVVFDDKLIDILRKYGIGAAATSPLYSMMNQPETVQ